MGKMARGLEGALPGIEISLGVFLVQGSCRCCVGRFSRLAGIPLLGLLV